MKRKIFLLAIPALLWLGSCKSLTQEGRSLNQARRALKNKDYTQSIDLAIQAIQLDPEFYEAMAFLSGAFREGNEYYQGVIDEYTPTADSIEQVEGDVVLPVDKIFQSYTAMDKMSRSVEAAGYEKMYDADEGVNYLCEIDYFEIEMGEWRPKAMETHYGAIGTFLAKNHPMEAKQAHKHALYLRNQYDSEYKDSATLEAEALEAAQIILGLAVRKNSRDSEGIDPPAMLQRIEGELRKNAEIMTYATIKRSAFLEGMIWDTAEASTEEMGLWAGEEGMDYLLIMDLNTQNSTHRINSSSKQSFSRNTFPALDGSGNPLLVENTVILTETQVLMNASVSGYGRLLETSTGKYYFSISNQAAAAEERMSYTVASPGTVNALGLPYDNGGSSALGSQAKADFNGKKSNDFLFLSINSDLPYYQNDGTTGTVTTVPVSTIYGNHLNVNQLEYFSYLQDKINAFNEKNSPSMVMPDLWEELTEKCYDGLVDILD